MMRPLSLAVGILLVTGIYLVASPDSSRVPPQSPGQQTGLRDRAISPAPGETSGILPSLAASAAEPQSRPVASLPVASAREVRNPAGGPAAVSADVAGAATNVSDLAGAEKLAVKVQGYSELSGEYRVGADGALSVPVIGRILIGNMTSSDLERALARRVAQLTSRETHVTVEVVDYRAIFVSGTVSKPGSYGWRPGVTVLHALAMAGGGSAADEEAGVSGVMAGIQKAVAHQKRNLAALARMQADRADNQSIEVPAKLIDLVGLAEANEVVKAEQTALRSRHAALGAKRAALQRATEMARKELVGLTAQAKRLEAQLVTRRTYKAQIDNLKEKGIVRADRSMDEFSRVADLEDRATTVAVATARVQATLAALERDSVNLEYDRIAELDQDIIKIGRDIAQLDIEIETERTKFRKLTGGEVPVSLMSSSDAARKATMKYTIVRRMAQGPVSLAADPQMDLKPDDILIVALD